MVNKPLRHYFWWGTLGEVGWPAISQMPIRDERNVYRSMKLYMYGKWLVNTPVPWEPSWWLNQPIWKICSSNHHPRGENKKYEWNHLGAFGYQRGTFKLAGYPTVDKNSSNRSTSSMVSLLETWKIPEKCLKFEGSETYGGFLWGDTKFAKHHTTLKTIYTPED